MSSLSGISNSSYASTAVLNLFTSSTDSGVDVLAALSETITNAQKSNPNGWTSINSPQKTLPGNSATVPLGSQRALKRTVSEADAGATAAQKAKPFDAGMISQNSGRIAIVGQVGANDGQDSYKITLNTPGKLNVFAPNPDYNSSTAGSKVSLGDAKVEVFNPDGSLLATSDTRDAQHFSNWISLSTEGLGGLQVAKGSYTVKVTRENPASNIQLALTAKDELDFSGTVLDDNARIGSVLSGPASFLVTNSAGVQYKASYQLVKTADGGTPSTDPNADAKAGLPGGPDKWEMQLISLTPMKTDDPAADPAPSASAPITLGTFSVSAAVSGSTPPSATFTASNASITFAGGLDNGTYSLAASKVLTANMKLSADGAHSVPATKPVNYTLYAVMGDPGATTFYTLKNTPLTAAEQKAADQQAAIASAQSAAKTGGSSAILSLFA
ncbi:MAG: hypothetical protein ACOVVK_15090 [Elsteraceae bacterium]